MNGAHLVVIGFSGFGGRIGVGSAACWVQQIILAVFARCPVDLLLNRAVYVRPRELRLSVCVQLDGNSGTGQLTDGGYDFGID